jgi:hypothetical protein
MTIRPDGVFSSRSFRDIQRETGIPADVLAHFARDSAWLSGPPSLDASGETVDAEAAHMKIAISLADGLITKLRQ